MVTLEKTNPKTYETQVVYQRPVALAETTTHYCPGCTHGVAHRLVAEVFDEMNIRQKVIGVAAVGCSVFSYKYFDTDFVEAAHGRAAAMATGIKRLLPDNVVFTYQGDGDLVSIGMAETVHAAARGENITIIFINNAIYGMTGGQMAPTTLPGMKTTSSPNGRNTDATGMPIRMSELLSTLDGAAYIARRSLNDPANIRKAKKAIRLAFETQVRGLGFSMVELLSTCPTNWKLTPSDACVFVEEEMVPAFPLGDYKVSPEVKSISIR